MLRAEKGYIIVGQETDGTVTPDDLGLDWAIGKAEARFRRQALARSGRTCSQPDRKQLVGLLTEDPAVVLEEGAQIAADASPVRGTPALGPRDLVLSERRARAARIALAHGARRPRAHRRDAATSRCRAAPSPSTVAEPMFYDTKGERLDG